MSLKLIEFGLIIQNDDLQKILDYFLTAVILFKVTFMNISTVLLYPASLEKLSLGKSWICQSICSYTLFQDTCEFRL